MFDAGIMLSEFGTRRRRSYKAQDLVIQGLVRARDESKGRGRLVGTSNVGFLLFRLCLQQADAKYA